MKASTFRDKISGLDPTLGTDDLSGLVIGLAVWLTFLLAAPLLVLILAGALFSVELPVLVIVALVLVLARFSGLIPWIVVIVDRVSGQEQRESTRSFVRALRRVREINGDRRIVVRWSWS
jgi:fatty acid desaturase